MNIKELLEKQNREFDEKFPLKQGLFNTKSGWIISNADPKELKLWYTSSLKELITELIKEAEGKEKPFPIIKTSDRGTLDEIRIINKVMGYNQAIEDQISLLQEIKDKIVKIK